MSLLDLSRLVLDIKGRNNNLDQEYQDQIDFLENFVNHELQTNTQKEKLNQEKNEGRKDQTSLIEINNPENLHRSRDEGKGYQRVKQKEGSDSEMEENNPSKRRSQSFFIPEEDEEEDSIDSSNEDEDDDAMNLDRTHQDSSNEGSAEEEQSEVVEEKKKRRSGPVELNIEDHEFRKVSGVLNSGNDALVIHKDSQNFVVVQYNEKLHRLGIVQVFYDKNEIKMEERHSLSDSRLGKLLFLFFFSSH